MTPQVRKVLMWGGALLLAFASGSVLGGFTVSGLAGSDKSLPDSSDVQNFWAAQDRIQASRAVPDEAVPVYADQPHGNHVCEGCDAGETRGRLKLNSLAGSYSGQSDNRDEHAEEADDLPAVSVSANGGH